MRAQYGLPLHEIREAEEAFWRYDTDKSGTIDRNELKPLLRYDTCARHTGARW
jgi:Ca2+-binding EF-hand superfamily protein